MQAEFVYNGVSVKLTGTPAEVAEAVKVLGAPATPLTIPTVPTPTPWVQPTTVPVDPTWIFQPSTTGTRLPGCICPQPGDQGYGQPWLGVCPAHTVTTCGHLWMTEDIQVNDTTCSHPSSAIAVDCDPMHSVWSVFGPVQ